MEVSVEGATVSLVVKVMSRVTVHTSSIKEDTGFWGVEGGMGVKVGVRLS